jgi:hypothetical protein
MACQQMGSALLGDWRRQYNRQVREGTEAEAEVSGGTSGGRRGGREEPSGGTVVEEEIMGLRQGAIAVD